MKQTLLIALICLAGTFCLSAQTEKGTVLLGGSMVFTTSDGSSVFSASPNVGLLIMDQVAITTTFQALFKEGTSSWAIGPAIRLYLGENPNGKFITQVGINFGGAKNTKSDVGYDLTLGYAAFLNESIALELLASYRKTGDDKGIFAIGAGFQIHYHR
jgi:hypothetical protein